MKHKRLIAAAAVFCMAFGLLCAGSFGADSAPGSEADPLVSKSYVDSLFNDLEDSFEQKLKEFMDENETTGEWQSVEPQPAASSSFKVVEVPAGTKVIGCEGTEMIVRSGFAYAIDNGVDGISDLTAGTDLKGGTQISKNHLLLIPRTDGRGIRCDGLCYVMIKGDYSFE